MSQFPSELRPRHVITFFIAVLAANACAQTPHNAEKQDAVGHIAIKPAKIEPAPPEKSAMTDISTSGTTNQAPRNPAIAALELRVRILQFIDSLKTRGDTRTSRMEEMLELKLEPRSGANGMLFAEGAAAEGWEYGITVRLPDDSEPAWHTHIRFYPAKASSDVFPMACIYDFEAFALELATLGYKQSPRAFTLGGKTSWGFSKTNVVTPNLNSSVGVFVYRAEKGAETGRECIKSIEISYGVFE